MVQCQVVLHKLCLVALGCAWTRSRGGPRQDQERVKDSNWDEAMAMSKQCLTTNPLFKGPSTYPLRWSAVLSSFRPCRVQPSCLRSFSSRPHHPRNYRDWPGCLGFLTVALAALVTHDQFRHPIQNSTLAEEQLLSPHDKSYRRPRDVLKKIIDNPKVPMRERMAAYVELLQSQIVEGLSGLDPSTSFRWDHWKRAAGGSGTSCVLQDGAVFEKAGVNVSVVHGKLPPTAVRQMRHRIDEDRFGWWDGKQDLPFFACGISLVIHPVNPMAPTVHLNYRYFEIEDPSVDGPAKPKVWWFGGGTDLTPSYLFEEDATHFHQSLKTACDKHDKGYYPRFKAWCDQYFLIPHRAERRGVGGIFFDDLSGSANELFGLVRDLGDSFLPTYMPIIEQRQWMRYSDHHKRWQQLRRGRYVEFNLVHDRGTKFGLATPGARIESILMSLPLTSRWEYMPDIGADADSEEAKLLQVLKEPRDWA